MRGHGVPLRRLLERDRLCRPEDDHANARRHEQGATTDAVNQEGRAGGNDEVHYLEETIDKKLRRGVGDVNGVEDLVQVIRNKTVPGPLGEEGDGDDDPDTLSVAGLGEEGLPTNVRGDRAVEVDGGLDFLELVLNERVIPKILLG